MEGDLQGWALQLQKAEALFREGDLRAAHSLASRVVNADPDGKVGAASQGEDEGLVGRQPRAGGTAPPERLLIEAARTPR